MKKNVLKQGFTLVEIMIVVAIIAILAAIAIPNFVRSRRVAQRDSCIGNMKTIEGAASQYMLAEKVYTIAEGALWTGDAGDRYLKVKPVCPSNEADYGIASSEGEATVTCTDETYGIGGDKSHILPDQE